MATHLFRNHVSHPIDIAGNSDGIAKSRLPKEQLSGPSDASGRNSEPGQTTDRLQVDPVVQTLLLLARALEFSIDCHRCRWDFAVEIGDLECLGISHDELRWLIGKGLVEHARETGDGDDMGRSFDAKGSYLLNTRSCFVVTPKGLQLSRELGVRCDNAGNPVAQANMENRISSGQSGGVAQPEWDDQRHELRLGAELVKRFKWRACNQEAILAAFQEDGWPPRIDDPLPPVADTDPKRRLSDTIKCLNRKQNSPLVRFSGDGTGEGVLWDLVDAENQPQ